MFTHADRFSFAYFSFWMILIITHSGHWKNYSSNLIMILDTPMNIFQTAKIIFCMFGVRNDEKQSLIIWSQTNSKNSKQWMPLKCIVLQSFTHLCVTVHHKSQIFWFLDFCHNRFGSLKKTVSIYELGQIESILTLVIKLE